ncbi:MAG: 2-hydroxycarboxylate transporter family protein [Clostridium sp.]
MEEDGVEVNHLEKKCRIQVAGFPLPLYLGIALLVVVCMYTGCLPGGFVGGFIVLMVLGEGLNAIGNYLPIVKTYLGGSVICILGAAAIQSLGLIPQETHAILDKFVNQDGFLVFYISALITGSLFNIDRDLLLKATVKLLPTAVLSLAVGVTLSGFLGMCMGDSFLEGILYIGVPMTSGGMTAGTVPLSAIYASALGTDAGQILTRLAPATVLGNCVAIIFGGLANNLGVRKPNLTGHGRLVNDGQPVKPQKQMKPTFALLGTGLIISLAFYELGALCHKFIPMIPTYAWMIIAVIVVKSTRLMSEELEDAAKEWGYFAIHSWTAAALTGIGATLIDLKTIMHTITPFYLLSIVLIVAAITLTASMIGKLMGFYPLEAAIAAGMCTTNMGGSGNVAVLGSAKRMELLPFAQIVTRSCGALMLTLGGILVQFLR